MIAGAVLAAALLTVGSAAAVTAEISVNDHIVVITDAGKQNLPDQWFTDSVVLPGDSGTRTVTLENARGVDTTVTVGLTGSGIRSEGLLTDLKLEWDGGSGSLGDVAADSPTIADQVVLAPGAILPITLSYSFPETATQVPGDGSVSEFTIVLTATDTHDNSGSGTDGGTDGNTGGGTGSDSSGNTAGGNTGGLASTGGEISGPWLAGLLAVLAGWFLIAARRRRRESEAEA